MDRNNDPQPSGPMEWRPPQALRPHQQAGLVPAMGRAEYEALRADVAERGLLVPLEITPAGVVLDGQQRLRAARELGLERLPVRVVAPEDELGYMLRAALLRRHLSQSQRAALALELLPVDELRAQGRKRQRANLRQRAEGATLPPRGKTRDRLAAWAGVSARTLQDAASVRDRDPALFERVKRGDLAAHQAARRVQRSERDQQLPPPPPLPGGVFELVYADPPWQLGNPDGPYAPENHYPTLPLEQIKQLAVPAAEQAVLFLWAVNCLLPQALEVMQAWGFTYKTNLVWDKGSIGLGVWTRNRHELLLLGRKGDHPPPHPEDLPASIIAAPRGAHSQKPELVYQLIERAYPQASKLELYARSSRPGWSAWGNQLQP
jgi:N6-adenosine-specific RNA methylase IME4/ParB-like chromosome segregation protein Spo0J